MPTAGNFWNDERDILGFGWDYGVGKGKWVLEFGICHSLTNLEFHDWEWMGVFCVDTFWPLAYLTTLALTQ